MNTQQEFKKRDSALELLREHRAALIDVARNIAITLARKNKTVTSTEVIKTMKEKGFESYVEKYDKRFLGAVFTDKKTWTKVGYDNSGSHGRPVSVWRLK